MDPIIVEGPDGQEIEFPTGTDEATIARVMRQQYPPQQADTSRFPPLTVPIGDTPEEDAQLRAERDARYRDTTQGQYPQLDGVDLSELSDTERLRLNREGVPVPMQGPRDQAFNQGVTFGFSDEMGRAVDTVFHGSEEANARRDLALQQRRQFQNRAPVQSGVGEAVGGALTGGAVTRGGGIALNAVSPRAATSVANVARTRPLVSTAAGGSAGGSVAGAGMADDGSRAEGAAIGGTLGLLLGPAVRIGLGLASGPAGAIARRFSGGAGDAVEDQAASPNAIRFAERTGVARELRANRDALTPDGETFLAERSGPNARSTAVGLGGSGDDAQRVAEEAISGRSGGRTARVESAAGRATQLDDGVRAVDSLMDLDGVRDTARPLFNRADEMSVRLTPKARDLIRAINRSGVSFRRADELAGAAGDGRVQLSQLADDSGNIPDTVRFGDLRALAGAAEDEASAAFRNGRGQLGRELSNRARELRDIMRRMPTPYREASQIWRSAARDEGAFTAGQSIFKPGAQAERELNRAVTSGTSQSERRMFLAGIADAIERRMGAVSESGNAAAPLNRANVRDRLRRFLGDDSADELMARLDSEMDMSRFENVVNREVNAATDIRIAGRERVERGRSTGLRDIAAELIENPLEFIRLRGARRQVAEFMKRGDDEAIAEVARVLYSQGDVSDEPLVRAILREADRRGIQYGGAASGGAAVGQDRIQNRGRIAEATSQ